MVSLNKLPGVAQPAMQEGKYVAKLIKARLAGDEKLEPFKYFDKGSMATIGYRAAVADAFGMKFTGLIAYVMWMFIHMLYLIGWGNRLGTIYTWLRALVLLQEPRAPHHHLRAGQRPARRRTDRVGPTGGEVIPPRRASLAEAHPAAHEPGS